jgi:Flp pilus assembly protein TadG
MRTSSVGIRREGGTTTVEFAIVGVLLFVVLFAVIEFGRALFTMNTLTEASRRGARMAAVCPVGDPKPASVAVFDAGNGGSAVVSGLTTANILVEYLDINGAAIASPAANFVSIHYVRVSVVGFSVALVIPTLNLTLPMSGFSTVLPRESLGIPRAGTVTAC